MKYPVVSKEDVLRLIPSGRKERALLVKDLVHERGEGAAFDDSPVYELYGALDKLGNSVGSSPSKGGKQAIRWEAEAAVAVHDALRKYETPILMDLDFWTYLALGPLEKFVSWRYALGDGPIPESSLPNFGVARRSENLIFRLWSRAQLVYDAKHPDPYHIARRGSVDFWRSHVLRQNFCNVRTFARCFVEFQYPGSGNDENLSIDQIRELAKRIRRLSANVVFEVLDETQVAKMLARETAEIAA
jgi:hypothetical protein